MKRHLLAIDTATRGNRYDITPAFANANDFRELIEDLAGPFRSSRIDAVACIDALGFILGAAVACHLKSGVVPIRKGGKLPTETVGADFVDYSGDRKRLELRRGIVRRDARVLLVDDWIETGAQVSAAIRLLESQHAKVVGIAAIGMDRNKTTDAVADRYSVHTIWEP